MPKPVAEQSDNLDGSSQCRIFFFQNGFQYLSELDRHFMLVAGLVENCREGRLNRSSGPLASAVVQTDISGSPGRSSGIIFYCDEYVSQYPGA